MYTSTSQVHKLTIKIYCTVQEKYYLSVQVEYCNIYKFYSVVHTRT